VRFPFFRSRPALEEIRGDRVLLRFPVMDDYAAWADLRRRSHRFLEPWEPAWIDDDLTRLSFAQRIRTYETQYLGDRAYPYFIFSSSADVLLGAVTLSNVRRGIAQAATLGYWIGEPHARQGHMGAALSLLVPHAFTVLNLHRLEAACIPANEASARLLLRAGFREEGLARSYLKIAGEWHDHRLFAQVSPGPA
jgi:ribosomal-protein-alanine N-acetyltransferase